MRGLARLGLSVIGSLCVTAASAAPAEIEGYRLDAYQAPVPETLRGQPALTLEQSRALYDQNVLFIDVLPHAQRPEGLAPGSIWLDKPHVTIKGAHWLPEVGRGEISTETERYFKGALTRLTGGDLSRRMVIFCKRACWMSWNAAKRAQSYGYTQVLWFGDGIEAWRESDGPTETVTPDS
jgi:PQQ-dependent catabolism-associated CXXCW motif protein